MSTFYGSQQLAAINYNSQKSIGIARIEGTVAYVNFFPDGYLREGFRCSRKTGNYVVGDTRWQYNYYWSYNGTTWTTIATNSALDAFLINVQSGTEKIFLRADRVNHQTYRNYTYNSGSHIEYRGYQYSWNRDFNQAEVIVGAGKTTSDVYSERWHGYNGTTNYSNINSTKVGCYIRVSYNSSLNERYIHIKFTNSSTATRYIWLGNTTWNIYNGRSLSKSDSITYEGIDNILQRRVADYTTIQRWEAT